MSLHKVNVFELEPDDTVEDAGFLHQHAELGPRLGSRLIHATLYTAEAEKTIWPYHYHYGIEEWLYVISGEPVLRDPEGERRLAAGDVVCFPVGGAGAHTLSGPGSFVIFSTGRAPYMSVYPDSDKVSGPEGILLRSGAVEYWYGEGTWEPSTDPQPEQSAPQQFPRQPIVNVLSRPATQPPLQGAPPGFAARRSQLGPDLGAQMLGATLYELDPGEGSAPYHYHSGREEWLLVLSGQPTLRHHEGEDVLAQGDVVFFADGPEGAHRVLNRSSEPVRLVFLSTVQLPVSAHYPDSGKLLFRDADGEAYVFRKTDAVDLWDGEI